MGVRLSLLCPLSLGDSLPRGQKAKPEVSMGVEGRVREEGGWANRRRD